jgi:Lon protease-like protein
MKKTNITLPIFPLPLILLPEGMTKLRIFEPRYLKMVSTALTGQGFVIWLKDKNTRSNIRSSLSPDESSTTTVWGSWVEIINFDQGDDGILEIDVKCKSLVALNNISHKRDNLSFADVSNLSHWSEMCVDKDNENLSTVLASVFAENESLNGLYSQKKLSDTHWVLARWLEILPMELNVKKALVVSYSFKEAKAFVESIIFE